MLQQLRGKWALVTGASSGIGKTFCEKLAEEGIHLVIVARRGELLADLKQQLISKYQIKVIIDVCDLCRPQSGEELKSRLVEQGISVNLLINNAGMGAWGYFEQRSSQQYEKIISLNNNAMVSLCYAFYPDLVANAPDSAVINVSSQAAYQPVPFMAVYAASKAFVQSFSQALYGEWQEHGIEVQTLVPGPTKTEFDKKAKAYESSVVFRDEPEKVVMQALKQLGKKMPVVSSINTYKQRWFAGTFPSKMVINEVKKMFRPPNNS